MWDEGYFNTPPKGENIEETIPKLTAKEKPLEMNEDFDYSNFQVVRREFLAHSREPALTFDTKCRIYVNAACLSKFPDAMFAQMLVNQRTKVLALRPCKRQEKDSFQWSKVTRKGKRVVKPITCKLFYAKIFSLMGWNPEFRYKLLGRLIHSKGLYLIAFDLNAAEVYKNISQNGKTKISRTPTYPLDWRDQFGLTVEEHRKTVQVDVFNGYAIYSIAESGETRSVLSPEENGKNYPMVIPEVLGCEGDTNERWQI